MTTEHDPNVAWRASLGRRSLIRGSLLGGVGIAAAALIGCGDDDDDDDDAAATETAQASTTDDGAGDGDGDDGDAMVGSGVGELVQDPALPYPYNFEDPAGDAKPGGVMVVASTWDVGPMDPTVSASGGTVTVPNMVYNRLLGIVRGPQADVFQQPELEPELAASWERSPDGLTFTFNIAPGVTWQNVEPLNGRPFTAEDAAYALNRYASEGVHRAYYLNVSSIDAVDDSTLTITMAKPTADFLNPLGSNKQTIFPRELVDSGEIETKAIGTGPLIMKEAVQAQHVTFDKNPDYWEGDVLLDGFEFRVMPDPVARLAAFRVGQLDYAYALVANIQDLEALLETNPDVQVNLTPVVTQNTLGMNLTLPKYEDERVRRAMSLAIDRQEMMDIVFDGLAKALAIIPWPFIYGEEPTIESGNLGNWVRHDADEAMKLLQAAGAEGLSMENSFYPYSAAYTQTTEVVQAQLRDAGIDMTGGAVDYTEFNSQWVPRQLPDVSTSAWATSGYDADNWFHGQIHSESPGNRWRINDAEIDAWAEEQQLELDPDARKEIWQKIWEKDLDQMWRIPLPIGFGFNVYQPWVRGIRFTGSSPGDNSYYYTWGDMIWRAWLDK